MKDPGKFYNDRNHRKFSYIAWPCCVFCLQSLMKYIMQYHGTDKETDALNKLFGACRNKIVESGHSVLRFDADVKKIIQTSISVPPHEAGLQS